MSIMINRKYFFYNLFYNLLYMAYARVYMPVARLDLEICAPLSDFIYTTKNLSESVQRRAVLLS